MNPVVPERRNAAATKEGKPTVTTDRSESDRRIVQGRSARKRRSPWPTRVVLLLALVVGVVALVRALAKKPMPIETATVELGTVKDEVSSSTAGEVMAEKAASVRAELVGRVLAVKHRRGERVKNGEVVVALDTADLDARLQQARAMLLGRRAQVAQAEAHAEAARRTADTEKQLVERGAMASRAAEDAAALAREADALL